MGKGMSTFVRNFIAGLVLSTGIMVTVATVQASPPAGAPEPAVADASPAATVWVQRRIHAGIVYFLDNAARIRRYTIASGTWSPDIALPGAAGAFDVDASGIYVKFADRVERYALDGSTHNPVPVAQGDWPFLEVMGNVLILGNQDHVSSYDKTTGTQLSSVFTIYQMFGSSSIEAEGLVFGRSQGLSPSDIIKLTLNRTTGVIQSVADSPYHGSFPDATAAYAREAGGFVLDSSGTVYASAAFSYVGNLGGAIQGAAFLPNRFVVMRGTGLVVFSNDLRELGRIDAPPGLLDIFAVGSTLYAISGSIGALTIAPLDVTPRPATPPGARRWGEAAPKADFILGDANDLLLVSKVEHAAYAFNPANWAFEQTIPLFVSPLYAAYSPITKQVHAAYEGGGIYSFARQAPGTATWLGATPYSAFGLATAGEYIFAADPSGPWASHYMFSPTGTMLGRKDWNYYSRQYEWDPVTRRMYFFRDDTSPNDLHWERIAVDGTIAAAGESPYHGEVQAATPIRVSADGSRVVLGSGQVFESGGLTLVGNLGQSVSEIAWWNGDLYAITDEATPMLRRYGSNYQVVSSGSVRGTPRRLLPSTNGFVYVADVGSSTIVGRLDAFLTKADLAVDPLAPGSVFASGSMVTLAVSVGNNGTVPANGATVRASLAELDGASWRCLPGTLVAGCSGATGAGAIDHTIDLADGGQAVYEIKGRIPASVSNEVVINIEIVPAAAGSDPELRNNTQAIHLKLDSLFHDGFE